MGERRAVRQCTTRPCAGARPIWWLVLLLGVPACGQAEGPTMAFSVDRFEPVAPGAGSPELQPAAVHGETGRIDVHGIFLTPDACDQPKAGLEARADTLTLRVTARLSARHPRNCGPVEQDLLITYSARIRDLPPGAYRLQVIYDYQGSDKTSVPGGATEGSAVWRNRVAWDGTVHVE